MLRSLTHLFLGVTLIACTFGLAGCGSRPESAVIEADESYIMTPEEEEAYARQMSENEATQ